MTPATVVVTTVADVPIKVPGSSTKWLSFTLAAATPLIVRVSTGVMVPRGWIFQKKESLPSNVKEISSPRHGTNSHSMSHRPSPDTEKSRSPELHSGHLGNQC